MSVLAAMADSQDVGHDASSRSQSPLLYMCALGVSSTCCFSSLFLTAMMNSWLMVIWLAKPSNADVEPRSDYSSLQYVFLINLIRWRSNDQPAEVEVKKEAEEAASDQDVQEFVGHHRHCLERTAARG
jgi:hypothetical protein